VLAFEKAFGLEKLTILRHLIKTWHRTALQDKLLIYVLTVANTLTYQNTFALFKPTAF